MIFICRWRIIEGEELQTPNNGIIKKTSPITSSEIKDNDVCIVLI